MNFDKWFNGQSTLVKVILLILPLIGWICEILVRLSSFLRTKSIVELVVLLVFIFAGWAWILGVIDLVWLLLKGKLFLTE